MFNEFLCCIFFGIDERKMLSGQKLLPPQSPVIDRNPTFQNFRVFTMVLVRFFTLKGLKLSKVFFILGPNLDHKFVSV